MKNHVVICYASLLVHYDCAVNWQLTICQMFVKEYNKNGERGDNN